MAPSKQHYDEGGQLQLMEPDRVEEEEECFESIDKCTFPRLLPTPSLLDSSSPTPPVSSPMLHLLYLFVPDCPCVTRVWFVLVLHCVPVDSASRIARIGRNLVLFRREFDASLA